MADLYFVSVTLQNSRRTALRGKWATIIRTTEALPVTNRLRRVPPGESRDGASYFNGVFSTLQLARTVVVRGFPDAIVSEQ